MTEQQEAKPPHNLPAEVWPANKPMEPPEGIPIIKPFKELMQFWPNDQWDRDDVVWVEPFERRYLAPLGEGIAKIFGVGLINDEQYISGPEDAKATYLSCVLTRSQIKEVHPGVFEWYPICIVIGGSIIVAVQVQADPANNNNIEIPMALCWASSDQEYIPIADPVTNKVDNPAVLLDVFRRYAQIEFAPPPPQPQI
ncbi:hypothetical protein LCGC14_1662590 [marine sediment metagenome]|uniref:Uncharacterized protein n=1 Tax=marine sediment metagenome TaxID=412755 RepID=A0A0F9IG38_9ZZZZ